MKDSFETQGAQVANLLCPECGSDKVYMHGHRTNSFDGMLNMQFRCWASTPNGVCGTEFKICFCNTKQDRPTGSKVRVENRRVCQ